MNNFVIYEGFFDDQPIHRPTSASNASEPELKITARYVYQFILFY